MSGRCDDPEVGAWEGLERRLFDYGVRVLVEFGCPVGDAEARALLLLIQMEMDAERECAARRERYEALLVGVTRSAVEMGGGQ